MPHRSVSPDMGRETNRQYFARVGLLIVACTVLLTASFYGVVAMLDGQLTGVGERLPGYLLVAAVAFVGTVVLLEAYESSGRTIIVTASIMGLLTAVLVPLGVEGFLYALDHPDEVVNSTLFLYLLAAALIGTGLGYWGLNHWREFTGGRSSSGL